MQTLLLLRTVVLVICIALSSSLHGSVPAPDAKSPWMFCSTPDIKEINKQIKGLLFSRDSARRSREFPLADALKTSAISLAPSNYTLSITDTPTGSTFALSPSSSTDVPAGPTVLQLSHLALGASSLAAANRAASLAVARLHAMSPATADHELMGCKSADAAFWFALAGVREAAIFELLADVATREIPRFGKRASCRPKDLTNIISKLTVAGVHPNHAVFATAQSVFTAKGIEFAPPAFSSPNCLIWLFRFGSRNRGQRTFLAKARRQYAMNAHLLECESHEPHEAALASTQFDNPELPLVLDLGCGFGTTVLGLSTLHPEYNFLGVDRNPATIGYALGIAERRGEGGNVRFVVGDAMDVAGMDADVVMINFPTPFASEGASECGNSQLPGEDEWMVTPSLLTKVRGRVLLLQSNAEDVAVVMRRDAEACGWEVDTDSVGTGLWTGEKVAGLGEIREPQRCAKYVERGGERAAGEGWYGLDSPLLPEAGITETECNARATSTPVLRCLLKRRRR